MAETPHESKPRTRLRRRKNGVALVVVLGAMALIAFLVLTILTLNRAEQRAATNSAELTDVRNLADLPAQVVISQIRRATQNLGTFFNWTSQPGLIRVFNVENSSDPDAAPTIQQFRYPLYSTQTLYASGPPDFAAEATELAQWTNSKALYVDLNEPIEIRQDLTTGAPIPTANPGTLVYPILDPAAFERVGDNGESRVQGLAINGTAPATSPRHLMPMPVRWLYVLSTGKILSPLPGGDLSIARFDMAEFRPQGNEPAPRIIGRIAFWTDDESCKINLNTASEPAPWHPPMTVSERDRWAADTQPVRGETHRLSGHPAYTALSPVFRSLGGLASPAPAMQPQPQPPTGQGNGVSTFKDYLTAYHSLLPQTPKKDTGSVHGTELVLSNTTPPPLRSPALWSNVDEFLFDAGQPNGTGALRQRNGFQSVTGYALDEADIRRARFCLTTHSSAPETNPFNQPKISLWPVQTDPAQRTRTDQLMALAATIGGTADTRAYYGIQRDSAWSGTATPGSSHSTNADLAPGSRNRQLFNWLQTSTSNPFPAHPGSFEDKYGPLNRDQLLLSMFDLTRWTSNPGNAWTDNGPTYDYLAPSSEGTAPPEGSGMVTPLIADTGAGRTLRSPGRIPTITEAAIVFVAVDAKKDLNGQIEAETEGPWIGYAKKTTHVRAFIVLEPYITSPGFPAINPNIKYVLKGLNGASTSNPESPSEDMPFTMASHTLNGRTLNFGGALDQYELINQVTFSPSFPNITTPGGTARRFGGDATSFTGLTSLFVERDGQPRRALAILNPTQEFPWFSIPIDISTALPEENPMLNYSGGDLVLEIRHATTDTLLQEIALPFTQLSGQIPMPRLPLEDFAAVGPNDTLILNRFNLLVDPANPNAPPYLPLIKRGDVVRAVTLNPTAPHRGDVRMLASRYRVPKDWFTPAAIPPGAADDYEKHGLRETTFDSIGQIGSTGTNMLGAQTENRQIPATTVGSLLQNGPPLPPFNALPQGITAALSRTALDEPYDSTEARYGDWETGSGSLPDGPFFSRQDLTNAISQEDARRGTRDNIAATYTDGGELAIDAAGLSHTPQRQVSSAFIFGALTPFVYGIPDDPNPPPTGPPNPEPWRTLLFCPNPISRTSSANAKPNTSDHPGFGAPDFKIAPDHLWLEFFWTPVVEPQFLSPAFSTQGKVNLNCQMIPFTWIERTTALHAAFKGVRIPAIHHSAREIYKAPFDPSAAPTATAPEILYEVDVEKTLKAFRNRFTAGQVFYHPSEICDTYLFPRRIPGFEQDYSRGLTPPPMDPANVDYEQLNEWWNGNDPNDPLKLDAFELTGDNLRESPYAQVYPRLCTRSNVYKVHYRVQLISKSRSTPANQWNVETEKITAEQRGAVTIERYLDPNDPNIPDMTSSTLALDDFYRYRILTTEPFTP